MTSPVLSSAVLLAGGVGLFLHGLSLSTKAFRDLLGERTDNLVGSLLQRREFSFVTGAFLSALSQSSTAATSLAVGLVSAGLLPLESAITTMIGASVGTTFVTFILALNLVQWAPLGLGISAFILRSSRKSWRKAGALGLGISLILTGMLLIQQGVLPLGTSPALRGAILSLGEEPLLAGLLAFSITAVLQSSVPVTGLSIALVSSKLLSLEAVFFLAGGAHLGTSIMVLFAGMGAGKHPQALAWSSFLYKLSGILLLLPLHSLLPRAAQHITGDPGGQIMLIQSVIIWGNAALLLPFPRLLLLGGLKFAGIFGGHNPGDPLYIEGPPPPLPQLALSLLSKEMVRVANLTEECVFRTLIRPGNRERRDLAARSSAELVERCTEYLLTLPPPGENVPEVREEYLSLAHSLSCLRELVRLTTENMMPQYDRLQTKQRGNTALHKRWGSLGYSFFLVIHQSFGSFALGGSGDRGSSAQRSRQTMERIQKLQRRLERDQRLFESREKMDFWELLLTLFSMVRYSLCLMEGSALGDELFAHRRSLS